MCGITGIVGKQINNSAYHSAIKKMNDAIAHRGPDSEGTWNDEHCYLGHRRLSIIDLSEAGNQPFLSQDGRYILIYNGELYNYKDIRLELQRAEHGTKQIPYIFRTDTDTEVVLAAYLRWGKDCVKRFNGMFAFSIWDTADQKLVLARDRMGIKPVYYQFKDNVLLFASEIRALLYSGLIEKKISLKSVAEFIQYATVHAPNTILQDVFMLMPGHILEYQNRTINIQKYWNINDFAKSKQDLSYKETCTQINELLTASVERRLVADVPFGAFLSGGIDSSAIVGLMSKVSSEKVRTFNVSFDESEFSEAKYAKQISEKFNTEHHEIKLTPDDFLKQLPEALAAIDHPSGDGPNSYIVSKATKQAGITMALSGLGGDELFAGYDIFKRYYELEKKGWLNIIPAKGLAGKLLAAKKNSVQGDKTAEILNLDTINGFHAYPINRKLFNQKDYRSLLKEQFNDSNFIKNVIQKIETDKQHVLSRVSLFEIQTYMQNILLRDADQMSMAVALEVRVPFLDYKLVEFVLGVKDEYKYPHSPKKLLTDALGELLPDNIVNRPKMGFTLPWKDWLKGELKDFCEENIVQFSKRSFVNRDSVLLIWNRFLNNDPKITWSRVWHLVILNNWINTHQVEC
ncbi:MAG: asparagine synthase, glutamine-hydrolyzing [Bacteroidetes bacterium]|jgi:asparagine synthase (glutamine-hydrolysing)|nr:asparagine synthase, glutamine-hydrolyzing [Bacteroidota bacterium]MDF2450793.1 asparagine synthase, glutamine-hydrolyzing [Bacteroidota bacterium]